MFVAIGVWLGVGGYYLLHWGADLWNYQTVSAGGGSSGIGRSAGDVVNRLGSGNPAALNPKGNTLKRATGCYGWVTRWPPNFGNYFKCSLSPNHDPQP